ncbi:MAG: hypothetical protein ACI85K_003417, partial [Hyphomicrobiaceae bacterium]
MAPDQKVVAAVAVKTRDEDLAASAATTYQSSLRSPRQ